MVSSSKYRLEKAWKPMGAGLILLLLAVLASPFLAAESRAAEAVEYEAAIEGLEDEDLLNLLRSVSDTFSLKDRPPSSLRILESRMKADLKKMEKALGSRGYFKAAVVGRIDRENDPPRVVFEIRPGSRFVFAPASITPASGSDRQAVNLLRPEELGLAQGEPFRSEAVVEAQKKLLLTLGRKGHPYPKVVKRRVVADHQTETVAVSFIIDPGPKAVFGRTSLTGLSEVKEKYVLDRLPWGEGDDFNADLLGEAKRKLLAEGLFSTADFTLGRVDAGNRLPVEIKLKERAFRTIGFGLGYETDTGPGLLFSWEHRNFMGAGEKFKLDLELKENDQSFEGSLVKPNFLKKGQSLVLKSTLAEEHTDAYDSRSLENYAAVERELFERASAGLGLKYTLSREDEGEVGNEDDENFGLVSIPLFFKYDYSDDLLDPSKGGRLNIFLTPYHDTLGSDLFFYKFQASYSHYLELIEGKKLILAGRVLWGAIEGADRDQMPQSELFYAGGGGSVRGYAYQTAGEMDVMRNEPLGGLSVLELSTELRFRITESVGIVGFLDGGSAFSGSTPGESDRLLWGTGLGLRYYSPIGPLRFDFAVPLSKRDGIDDDFQIYLSLGQAF